MLDIHSHILPGVDDGAKNSDAAFRLLSEMYSQGITDVIATPHFYPDTDGLESYFDRIQTAYKGFKAEYDDMLSGGNKLPNVYIGSEVLYFRGILKSEHIGDFTLNNSRFLLVELTDGGIEDCLYEELSELKNERGIIPIIAHIERYHKSKNFKKLLKFIKEENIPAQINASSFFIKGLVKPAEKLVKQNLAAFIATDAHSPEKRPPMMQAALEHIATKFGDNRRLEFINNSECLFREITTEEPNGKPYA